MDLLAPGQQVVWLYRPHITGGRLYLVDVEVVYIGHLRTRIRIKTTTGGTLLRWVKLQHLRGKAPGEPVYPYPEGCP